MSVNLKQLWEESFMSFTSLLRFFFVSNKFISLERITSKESNDCVILGNGPSLTPFIDKYKDDIDDKVKICVNYFVRSEFYELLQPDYYVICSPEYWRGEKKKGWSEDRVKTFELIAERTKWPLIFYVPKLADNYQEWKKIIGKNPNIKIKYFNNVPIEGFSWFRNMLYQFNFGMPRPHNVLVPSLMIAIGLNYRNVFLTGADHSWLKELNVTEDNVTLLRQRHFYEEQKTHVKSTFSDGKAKPMYYGGSERERKLHDVLEKFYYSFKAYWEIKDYAENSGTKVYNLTLDSYIDAFDKITLDGFSVKETH